MYSFFLLLSIWFLIIGLFSQRLDLVFGKMQLLPLTFVLSCIVQFNLNYTIIANVQSPDLISKLLLLMACIFMASSLLVSSYRRKIISLFRSFLLPVCQLVPSESKSTQKLLVVARGAILVTATTLMLFTQILTATVNNWDSHYYNLARIPAMIIEHSVFPENTGSLWQLLHPIGHDLLYLLDIAVLSLRGMGLVSCLEFLVILGCLYQIALNMLSTLDSRGLGIKTQYALLLVTVLFISSDLQVLQSADPKNDLVIVMTFVISLSLSIDPMLRRNAPCQYMLSIMLVLVYSISSKAYGMIVLIPPIAVLLLDALRIAASKSSPWRCLCDSLEEHIMDGRKIVKDNKMLLVFVVLNVCLLAFAFISHAHSIANSSHAQQMEEMAATMSNVTGSASARLTNFALNTGRNFIAFILYPYSTLLKWNAKTPDDYIFGFGPLTQLMNDPRGLINASTVVRTIKADSAYGSILIIPLIILLSCMLSRKIMQSRLSMQALNGEILAFFDGRSQFRHMSIVVILCCSLAFFFFSYALLAQSFGSKYMGATYVPLIPLLSVGFVELISLRRKIVIGGILIASCYAILRLGFLLTMPMNPNLFSQLASPSSLAVYQSPNLLFYQFVGSRSSVHDASRFLNSLSTLSSDQVHVICFGTETPSLTPLMYAIQSFNHDVNLDIRLSSNDNCKLSQHPGLARSGKKANFIGLP
jgi:hypothetical protein